MPTVIYFNKYLLSTHIVAANVRSKNTSGSAIAEGPREALVSRNPATTKHLN